MTLSRIWNPILFDKESFLRGIYIEFSFRHETFYVFLLVVVCSKFVSLNTFHAFKKCHHVFGNLTYSGDKSCEFYFQEGWHVWRRSMSNRLLTSCRKHTFDRATYVGAYAQNKQQQGKVVVGDIMSKYSLILAPMSYQHLLKFILTLKCVLCT